MKYDFIEIGTCNFTAICQSSPEGNRGICIEPVREYLQNLPEKIGVTKLCAAISNVDGETTAIHLKPEVASTFSAAVRGCTAMGRIHPKIKKLMSQGKIAIDDLMHARVPQFSLFSLYKMFDVTELGVLKIDAEGMDTRILLGYFQGRDEVILPDSIVFEANELSPEGESDLVINLLKIHGYAQKHRGRDVVMVR